MSKIEIAVSPFYSGNGWTDRGTGIKFEPQTSGQLKTKSFNLSDKEDLTGIKNSVRLNHLLILNGNLDDVADKPEKVNPEELSGEELDKMLSEGGSNDALVKENQALTKENKALEKQVKELQAEVKENQASTKENKALEKQVKELQAEVKENQASTKENKALEKQVKELQAEVKENQALTKENKALEKQVKELQAEVKEFKEKEDDFKRNKDGSIDKKALNDDNTREDLITIADDNNVEFDSKAKKADIVDLIVEKLQ